MNYNSIINPMPHTGVGFALLSVSWHFTDSRQNKKSPPAGMPREGEGEHLYYLGLRTSAMVSWAPYAAKATTAAFTAHRQPVLAVREPLK